MKNQIEVVAAVIEKEGKIFCAQRPNKGEVALKWEFPGGKVEAGETKEAALKREIKEELNSEIEILEFITTVNYEYKTFYLIMHVYRCKLLSGNLDISEHVDSCWIDKANLKSLDWAPADLDLIDYISGINNIIENNLNYKIPILDYFGDEGIITPNSMLSEIDKVPNHIDTAIVLFERKLNVDILDKCEVFYEYKGGSFSIPQYIYDNKIVIALAPLGSAAAAGLLENLIALGLKKFIACGSAGCINKDIDASNFVIVEKAIRDEGTSYHYLPSSLMVELNRPLINHIEKEMDKLGLSYAKGVTWTTDGIYRETPERINLRLSQGAICVEMECAAFAAVALFRKVQFAQILYFSDIVHQEVWSGFVTNVKEIKDRLNDITLKIALALIE